MWSTKRRNVIGSGTTPNAGGGYFSTNPRMIPTFLEVAAKLPITHPSPILRGQQRGSSTFVLLFFTWFKINIALRKLKNIGLDMNSAYL